MTYEKKGTDIFCCRGDLCNKDSIISHISPTNTAVESAKSESQNTSIQCYSDHIDTKRKYPCFLHVPLM